MLSGAQDSIRPKIEGSMSFRICCNCTKPFEVLEPRNPKEIRCIDCQTKYRLQLAEQMHKEL